MTNKIVAPSVIKPDAPQPELSVSERQARDKTDKKSGEPTGKEIEGGNQPLDVFSEENDRPYLSELLYPVDEDSHIFNEDKQHEYQSDLVGEKGREDITKIDNFMNKTLDDRGSKSDTKSYKELFKEMKKDMGLKKSSSTDSIIQKFLGVISALKSVTKTLDMDRDKALERLLVVAKEKKYGGDELKLDLLENFGKEIKEKGSD